MNKAAIIGLVAMVVGGASATLGYFAGKSPAVVIQPMLIWHRLPRTRAMQKSKRSCATIF